jgi:hypothetical protein
MCRRGQGLQKVKVIILTYKRLHLLPKLLQELTLQTFKNFSVHISHSDINTEKTFKKNIYRFSKKLDISFSIDSNELLCFRRYLYAKNFAQQGAEIVFFIDDDVSIPENYLEKSIEQYSPKSYLSCYAHSFLDLPPDYSRRKRELSKSNTIGYCGPGMSMIDPSIFLYDDFFNSKDIVGNYQFDDIWLSFFAHTKGWSLNYLDSEAILGGNDSVAMYKTHMQNKSEYVQNLYKNNKWDLKI